MKILINDKLVEITPAMVAMLFCDLDDEEQAKFYNTCADLGSKWCDGKRGWCFQLQAITDSPMLTYGGRRFMAEVGEYSHWGLVPEARKEYLKKVAEQEADDGC